MRWRTWLGVLVLAWCTQSLAEGRGPIRLWIELADGSRIAVTTQPMDLVIRTEALGQLQLPLRLVRSVVFSANRTASVRLANDDHFQGEIMGEGLMVESLLGKLHLSWSHVKQIQVAGQAGGVPLDGLLLQLRFDRNEGHRITDPKNPKNFGEVRGATWTPDGRHGGAMQFDGVDDHIVVVDSAILASIREALTIAMWVSIAPDIHFEEDASPNLLAKGAIWAKRYADFALTLERDHSAVLEITDESGQTQYCRSEIQMPTGRWVHLAATFASGVASIYINGRLDRSVNMPTRFLRTGSEPLYLGCRYQNPQRGPFKGLIDEVLIYNRALSEMELKALTAAD
ncbi:MAG: LamG domain-containing protein [Verrucomicrobiae bacterium]|nr:LamG domain-containing protein [Verrucomicrobiae bacterium]MDW8344724.1 LamG domain-containing protein [Verrucomicrobiae bacterium]